ncbi:trypsin-1-like [Eurosta solidaginis]|uniref:trypsin-1-like n=1 Tax=Eurosta solidaginis TaxID=178769 RepID=UPI0035315305
MAHRYLLLLAFFVTLSSPAEFASVEESPAPTQTSLRQDDFIGWIAAIFRPPTTTSKPAYTLPTAPPRDCAACKCGTINTFHRIVGGMETELHEYPWMAMLLRSGDFYCGGSLINDQYVLTAAHCVRGFNRRVVSVRLLSHNRTDGRVSTIDRQLDTIIVHEDYSSRNIDNDIALLRFTKPVKLSEPLKPVCLAEAGKTYEGEIAVVTGWGSVKEGGYIADSLQEVQVPVMSQEDCRKSKYGADRITDNMLCAGYPEGGKDSCQGDSGGPLHVGNNATGSYHLAGIVSWGEGCARPNAPGVYTRVTQYLDWIEERTRDACKCQPAISPGGSGSENGGGSDGQVSVASSTESTTGGASVENSSTESVVAASSNATAELIF